MAGAGAGGAAPSAASRALASIARDPSTKHATRSGGRSARATRAWPARRPRRGSTRGGVDHHSEWRGRNEHGAEIRACLQIFSPLVKARPSTRRRSRPAPLPHDLPAASRSRSPRRRRRSPPRRSSTTPPSRYSRRSPASRSRLACSRSRSRSPAARASRRGLLPADAMARLIMTRKYMPAPCFSPAGDPIPVVTAVCRFATAPSRAAVLAIARARRRVPALPRAARARRVVARERLPAGRIRRRAHVREHDESPTTPRDAAVSLLVCARRCRPTCRGGRSRSCGTRAREDALLIRVDHTLGDGLGLLRVFLAACETADGAPFPETSFDFVGASARARRGRPAAARAALGRALALAWRALWSLALVVKEAARKDSRTAVSPAPLNPGHKRLAARLSPPQPASRRSRRSRTRRAARSTTCSRRRSRARRARTSARAGGARAVAEARLVRALIPVAFPRAKLPVEHARMSVENKFAMCPTALAVGEPSARARSSARARVRDAQGEHRAVAAAPPLEPVGGVPRHRRRSADDARHLRGHHVRLLERARPATTRSTWAASA